MIKNFSNKLAAGRVRVTDVGANKLLEERKRDDDDKLFWQTVAEVNAAHLDNLIAAATHREQIAQNDLRDVRAEITQLNAIKTELYG